MAKKKPSKKEKKQDKSVAGLFIPAGIFIGMGIGFITGNVPAGLFLGMGAGFILFAIVSFFEKTRKK